MAFQAVPDVAQVDIVYSLYNQRVVNTIYFRSDTPITEAGLTSLAASVAADWETGILAQLSENLFLLEVVATDLSSQIGPQGFFIFSPAPQGGNTNPAAPGNVTIALSIRTAGRGRSSRGRIYLPGIGENVIEGNTILVAVLATWTGIFEAYIGPDAVAAGWTWVVVSRQVDGAPRPVGLAQDVTSVGFTDNAIDSQRRRLQGRGS